MKASFIIPLYNNLPLTQAMLSSLRATLPAGLEHEIIFADDGSTDGTRAWLAALPPPCRAVLNERNLGFAATCNRGAATASGALLFFLNNDLVLLPGWLEPMLALFTGRPDAGVIGNVQLNFATGAVDHAGIYLTHQGKPAHATRRGLSPWRETPAVTGACFGIRADLWRQLGGFDERYINGCEDIDLCLRAREAGHVNGVALRSRVRHHVSASTGRKLRDEQNTFRLVGRWRDRIAQLATRDWCRRLIADHADRSHAFDYPLVLTALLFLAIPGWPASALVRRGVEASIEREWQRWRELFEQVPPPPPPAAIRTTQI